MKIPAKLLKAKKLITKLAKVYGNEFDCLKIKDANNNEYFHLHFKPRGQESCVESSIDVLLDLKIRYAKTQSSDWKTVIWIPIDQKLNYIIHSLEEVYEVIN
jgi:hypothetical protein